MPACESLLSRLREEIQHLSDAAGCRRTVGKRFTMLVASLMKAESVLLRKLSDAAIALELTDATAPEDVMRTFQNILNDERLTLERFVFPLLRRVIDWDEFRRTGARVRIIVDDSTLRDRIHLFRAALAYRGTAIPLTFRVWRQNTKQLPGDYWSQVEAVFADLVAVLPADLAVLVLADRAFDVPPFLDRVTKQGWDYLVRLKQNSAIKIETDAEVEAFFREHVATILPSPGPTVWTGAVRLFKKAGWREVSVAMTWAVGQKEPLVVCSSLPPSAALLEEYDGRFWIEPSFKQDKSAGWDWEASQIRTPERHARLLVAMTVATLLTLILGAAEADAQRAAHPPTGHAYRTKPHAPASLFTLGLRRLRRHFCDPAHRLPPLCLTHLTAPSWNEEWQRYRLGNQAA
jgi:hypothetical protein